MMKRNLFVLLSALIVFSLLATGCRLGAPPTTSLPPLTGKVLTLAGGNPTTLDPARTGDATSGQYVGQIFSGLVRLDDNLEPVADIADRWTVSNDGRTYTFFLRQDVKFQDGRPVKAQDFKYSWERAANPATASLTASTYLGDIVGVREVLAGQATAISGVKVIDDYTLQVTIDAPKSYFLFKMTFPTSFVVNEANVRAGANWWRTPIGSGPFKLRQWEQNTSLILEKNSLYYGQVPALDFVLFRIFSGIPMNLYETGQIDVAGVSVDYIDRATDQAGPFYADLAITPELSFYYIGFNSTKPPFDDANIRRAFSMAIDKDKVVSLVGRDMVQRADGILPPGMPGYNQNLSPLRFDVAEAKRLIAQSKYGEVSKLPPITLTTIGEGGLIGKALEAVVYQWQQNLGVDVKVRQIEPERLLFLKTEKDEMFDSGWIADYPHPQDFLDVLFHSGFENNWGEYSNAEVDTLLEQADTEQNQEKSLALYQQAEQKLVSDAAALPLWFGKNYTLVKPYVKGYKLNPLGFAQLNEVTVEEH